MFKRFAASVFVVVMVAALVLGAQPASPAHAWAGVLSSTVTCSSVHASGSTNAAYVSIEIGYTLGGMYYFDWMTFPVSGVDYLVTYTFPELPAGTAIEYWVYGSDADGYWDYEPYYFGYVDTCDPANVPGPDIPDGFVPSLFTCDTALYVGPAEQAIADQLITAGQTFYVNPVGEEGADGQMWHQVFVGSYDLPYVPATCVAQ